MSIIQLKRTFTPGKIPSVLDLDYGELALNIPDKILYAKTIIESVDTIVPLNEKSNKISVSETEPVDGKFGDFWFNTLSSLLFTYIDLGSNLEWVPINLSSPGPVGLTGSVGNVGLTGSVGYLGSRGLRGFIGSVGLQGDIGLTGSRGVNGFVGSQGDIGLVGSQGIGLVGSQGDIGLTGSSGVRGFSGSSGSNGFTGSSGAQGNIGLTGSQGIGLIGSQGNIGLTGSQGNIGLIGSQGDIGLTGPQGVIGLTGSVGDIGLTGSSGVVGLTGSVGDIGLTGSSGFTGSSGSQGNIGLTGSQGIGLIGSSGVGLIGSQGDIGLTGSSGVVGLTGSSGFTGASGSQGEIGLTGSVGAGLTGSAGVQGLTGSIGDIGLTGSVGAGLTGSAGVQGLTGFVGSRGLEGNVGFVGSRGIQGPTGFNGSRGIQGPIGFVGSAGTGFAGSSGSGFIGSQGLTGSLGFTGSLGLTGSLGFTGSLGLTGSLGFTGSAGTNGFLGSIVSQRLRFDEPFTMVNTLFTEPLLLFGGPGGDPVYGNMYIENIGQIPSGTSSYTSVEGIWIRNRLRDNNPELIKTVHGLNVNIDYTSLASDQYGVEVYGVLSTVRRSQISSGIDLGSTGIQMSSGRFELLQNGNSNAVTANSSVLILTNDLYNGGVTSSKGIDLRTRLGYVSGQNIEIDTITLSIDSIADTGGTTSSATIGTLYHLRLQEITQGANTVITNHFGISQEDPEALNVFSGPTTMEAISVLMPNLPTTNPNVAGQLWVDVAAGRVIKQSAG